MYENIIIYSQIYIFAYLFPNLNKYLLHTHTHTQIYIYLQLFNHENSIITRCCVLYLAVHTEMLKCVLFYINIYFKSNNINFVNTDNIINTHYNNNINRI